MVNKYFNDLRLKCLAQTLIGTALTLYYTPCGPILNTYFFVAVIYNNGIMFLIFSIEIIFKEHFSMNLQIELLLYFVTIGCPFLFII